MRAEKELVAESVGSIFDLSLYLYSVLDEVQSGV